MSVLQIIVVVLAVLVLVSVVLAVGSMRGRMSGEAGPVHRQGEHPETPDAER